MKTTAAAVAIALLPGTLLRGVAEAKCASRANANTNPTEQGQPPQGKFFCNLRALTPSERAHHTKLTLKLMALRSETIPTDKGYEFQFDPSYISLIELTDWVAAESKCCPFFDFHIDLEHAGRLLWLRISGEQGIKPFIESEFHLR